MLSCTQPKSLLAAETTPNPQRCSSHQFMGQHKALFDPTSCVRRLFFEVDEGSVPTNREHFISHSMMMSWIYTINIALWTTKTATIWLYMHGICIPDKYMRRNIYLEKYSFTILLFRYLLIYCSMLFYVLKSGLSNSLRNILHKRYIDNFQTKRARCLSYIFRNSYV